MKVGRSSEICNGLCHLWPFLVFYLFKELDFPISTGICNCISTSEFLRMVKSIIYWDNDLTQLCRYSVYFLEHLKWEWTWFAFADMSPNPRNLSVVALGVSSAYVSYVFFWMILTEYFSMDLRAVFPAILFIAVEFLCCPHRMPPLFPNEFPVK